MMKCVVLATVLAQAFGTALAASSTGTNTIRASSVDAYLTEIPTDSRATYPSDQTTSLISTSSPASNATTTLSPGNSTAPSSTSSAAETQLHGTASASNPSATSVRCNGYEELCERKYSNVTYVVAHNSPFHKKNNAASNQVFDVTTQLDNGIRGSERSFTKELLCNMADVRQSKARRTITRTMSTFATLAAMSLTLAHWRTILSP